MHRVPPFYGVPAARWAARNHSLTIVGMLFGVVLRSSVKRGARAVESPTLTEGWGTTSNTMPAGKGQPIE